MCEFRVRLPLTRNSHAIQTELRHSLVTFSQFVNDGSSVTDGTANLLCPG
jgi:hypothetical protein